MPLGSIPAVDAQICSGWTEQQINLFNKLDFYLAKMQVDRRKTWTTWNKFTGKRRWQPNMGDTMRLVRKAPSPHIRQFAFPRQITGGAPKKDVMDVREVKADAQVYRHRFESPVLNFVPDFRDFMTDHVDAHGKDIMEKIERFEDIYLRGGIFHMAPYAFVAKPNSVDLISCPWWTGTGNFTEATDGKNAAFIQATIPTVTSHLTLAALNMAMVIMENDLGVPPFKGSGLPKESAGLQDKYCLVHSAETWAQFTFDPYLLANKNCDLDIVNDNFKGDLFGRITGRCEDKPIRYKTTGAYEAPEIRVSGGATWEEGDTAPNPAYTDPETSPIEVSFLVGTQGYESIDVGPPPEKFASGNPPDNFAKMFWNGEVRLTKKFTVPCYDDQGNLYYDLNTYGEHLKFISQASFGLVATQRRNIVPIFHKRKRGV